VLFGLSLSSKCHRRASLTNELRHHTPVPAGKAGPIDLALNELLHSVTLKPLRASSLVTRCFATTTASLRNPVWSHFGVTQLLRVSLMCRVDHAAIEHHRPLQLTTARVKQTVGHRNKIKETSIAHSELLPQHFGLGKWTNKRPRKNRCVKLKAATKCVALNWPNKSLFFEFLTQNYLLL